ncbi:MAG: c-type cytochrome [Sandaracinaceae bacterium]
MLRALGPPALVVTTAMLLSGCAPDEREVREWRPSDHQQPAQPDPSRQPGAEAPPASPELAATLWRAQCATCHGLEGGGDGPSAPGRIADLRTPDYQSSRTDEQIATAIRVGGGGMPSFSTYPDRFITALVDHVRSLTTAAEAP